MLFQPVHSFSQVDFDHLTEALVLETNCGLEALQAVFFVEVFDIIKLISGSYGQVVDLVQCRVHQLVTPDSLIFWRDSELDILLVFPVRWHALPGCFIQEADSVHVLQLQCNSVTPGLC